MEEETKFEIKDKRLHFTDDTDQAERKPEEAAKMEPPKKSADQDQDAAFPVTFSSFILSLATSALMHLGQEGEGSIRLPLARQVIDLISLLEEKTKGNRTSEEEEMLSQTLFALRMKFVEVEKKLRGTATARH